MSAQALDKAILSSEGIAAVLSPDSSPIITSRVALHAELAVERYIRRALLKGVPFVLLAPPGPLSPLR